MISDFKKVDVRNAIHNSYKKIAIGKTKVDNLKGVHSSYYNMSHGTLSDMLT